MNEVTENAVVEVVEIDPATGLPVVREGQAAPAETPEVEAAF